MLNNPLKRLALGFEVLITLGQAFRLWTSWNLGLRFCGLRLGLLPFLSEGPIVFNVPHVTDLWHAAICKVAMLRCTAIFEDLQNSNGFAICYLKQ